MSDEVSHEYVMAIHVNLPASVHTACNQLCT